MLRAGAEAAGWSISVLKTIKTSWRYIVSDWRWGGVFWGEIDGERGDFVIQLADDLQAKTDILAGGLSSVKRAQTRTGVPIQLAAAS